MQPGQHHPDAATRARLAATPLFVFIHIPKTAGTTFRALMTDAFPGQVLFAWDIDGLLQGRPVDDALRDNPCFFDPYMAVAGHVGVTYRLLHLSGRRNVFLGLMREPVERIVSHYDFIRARPEHELFAELSRLSLLEAMTQSAGFRGQSCNAQLRQLFGCDTPDGIAAMLGRHRYCIGRFDDLPAFVAAFATLSGATLPARAIPHHNAFQPMPGVTLARDQPDFVAAVAVIRAANAAEDAFFRGIAGVLTTDGIAPPRSLRPAEEPAPPAPERLCWPGTDPALHSQIGTRGADGIRLDGRRDGFALYGPYAGLPAGAWLAQIWFDRPPAGGPLRLEICSGGGARMHRFMDFAGGGGGDGSCTLGLDVRLAAPVGDIEVRLHVRRGFTGIIRALTLTRLADAP